MKPIVPTLNISHIKSTSLPEEEYLVPNKIFDQNSFENKKIIILTRGYSWHVGCVLRMVDLLKYITSIGGNSSVNDSTLWLNIIDNMLVIDETKNYSTKDKEILRLLKNGFIVRYIDDDPEE